MDEYNCTQFWGLSPAVDFLSLLERQPSPGDTQEPLRVLQSAVYDCRHTLQTLGRAPRHAAALGARPVHFYMHEEEPEVLARHLLLLAIFFDHNVTAKDRAELLLEVHGNALLREPTAAYVEEKGRMLESLVVDLTAGRPVAPEAARLAALLDLSHLKFQDRDALVEVFKKYRQKTIYDMVKGWDARCRRWYGERFDFQRNMIDWDYHMRLMAVGTPGQEVAKGCVIHFYHFRHWRSHGVALELRDCVYNQPNRTLLSTARGRTREFKDRKGRDVGRSVEAWGFWADILNSPYHCFGTLTEDEDMYKTYNKQFEKTAVDISQLNITALLHELRSGQRYRAPKEAKAKTQAARGPTTIDDIAEKGAKEAAAQAEAAAEAAADAAAPAEAAAANGDANGDTASNGEPAAAISANGNGVGSNGAAAPAGPAFSMADLSEALRAEEAAADAAAFERVKQWRFVPVLGDLHKQLAGKAKFKGTFDAAAIGHRHVHLSGADHGLPAAVRPGGILMVEGAKYLLQLKKEQVSAFSNKIVELAGAAGWRLANNKGFELAVRDAQLVFTNGPSQLAPPADILPAADAATGSAADAAPTSAAAAGSTAAAENGSAGHGDAQAPAAAAAVVSVQDAQAAVSSSGTSAAAQASAAQLADADIGDAVD